MTKKSKTVEEHLDKQTDIASLVRAYIESYGMDGGVIFRGFWRPKVDYNVGEYVAWRGEMLRCKKSHRSYLQYYWGYGVENSYIDEHWEKWHGKHLSHDIKHWCTEDEANLYDLYMDELKLQEGRRNVLTRRKREMADERRSDTGWLWWKKKRWLPITQDELEVDDELKKLQVKLDEVNRKIDRLKESTGLFKIEENGDD